MKKKQRGSLTLEAAIVLPFYILTICFVLNFMNIFYLQLAVQQGLNNTASTLSQYVYAVDLVTDVDKLALKDGVSAKATALKDGVTSVKGDLEDVIGILSGGFDLGRLPELLNSGKKLTGSLKGLSGTAKSISGDDVLNALLSGSVDAVGSAVISGVMNNYLDKMQVNRNLLDGEIKFFFGMDGGHDNDLILTAQYRYKSPMFSMFFDKIEMKQSVVVHPWIGGATKGLRQK